MIKCSLPSDEIKLNRLSIAHPRGLPDGLALLGFRVPGRQSAAAGDDCDALHGTPYFDMANEERHSAHSVGLRIRCAILFHRADRLPVLGAHHRYEDLGFFQLQYLR